MRLAFYAPMKPPDDPVPSGDRTIARSLVTALETLGGEVDLASRFRSRDGEGTGARQDAMMRAAAEEIDAIVTSERAATWSGWLTYHNYYKAPDLIGPAVSAELGIPYLLAEATRARKRLEGPWARYAKAAEAATDAASVVFYASAQDHFALNRDAPSGQHLVPLAPFLTVTPPAFMAPPTGRIFTAGMMRRGAKLASYEIIAQTLAQMPEGDWRMDIAGDGPARAVVEALMAPFRDRLRFLGALDATGMAAAFRAASLFFWPGVNEALGMVYLEAQAAGRMVIAQDRPGLRDVLPAQTAIPVEGGAVALANRITAHLHDQAALSAGGARALAHVEAHHLLPAAATAVRDGLMRAGIAT